MKNRVLFLILVALQLNFAYAQNMEDLLFELPDVIFHKIESNADYGQSYELRIKQPLDHKDHSKGYFHKKVYLTHKGYDRPSVIITQGYQRETSSIYEITKLLDANQIDVEHRYFGKSQPDSLDYNYLNLQQVTADLHHINKLFKSIYKNKWISTGISKGGETTIFYRYYYPEDVDVSIPYVAPLKKEYEDKRLYKFINSIGTDECRNDIIAFQRELLEKRNEIIPLLKYYSKGAKVAYSYLTFAEAFEYAVLEYSFSFWQSGISCDSIPQEGSDIDALMDHFLTVINIAFFGDASIAKYGSHYYQAAQEMGYYGFETDNFKDLLIVLPTKPNPHAAFVPGKISVEFDGELLKNVNKWLKKNPYQFIYINGTIDTWSATAVPPSDNDNSRWFFLEGKHHYNARIKNMNPEEFLRLENTLEEWLSLELKDQETIKTD